MVSWREKRLKFKGKGRMKRLVMLKEALDEVDVRRISGHGDLG